jgi:hypothetical protein
MTLRIFFLKDSFALYFKLFLICRTSLERFLCFVYGAIQQTVSNHTQRAKPAVHIKCAICSGLLSDKSVLANHIPPETMSMLFF